MEDIYIIGAGGFAKEIYALIKQIGGYTVKGFINIEKIDDLVFSDKIVPVIEESAFLKVENKKVNLAFGIGNPKVIKLLSEKFKDYTFPNLFHPNVCGDFDNIKLGRGNIFTAHVTLTTCIKIGDYNLFNLLTTIGHDVVIGNCNVINPSVNISGGVSIGDANLIGVGATILQYKKVGNNSTVGAASLVIKNVPDFTTVVGAPARTL